MTKTYQLTLRYYKQGDDFREALDWCDGSIQGALEHHKNVLLEDVAQLEALREIIAGYKGGIEIKVVGDSHCIFVTGPTDVLQPLVVLGLLWELEPDDD